jgi:hypothetical protein
MAKKTEVLTSFHGTVINSTINELTRSIKPQYDAGRDDWGFDKTTIEWTCETKDGDVFTIYDWKEYRLFDEDESNSTLVDILKRLRSER